MGAKDYDFADESPSYREETSISYRAKNSQRTRKKRKPPKNKAKTPGGIHQRRNRRVSW